ncbi:hypothetical protein P153DRAFT_373752 [Dothidotthia symphoricarpi CBS 119687]|uniref:Rhodopsin domain-containing protein n=1 Tax=Dothidotthia symphoricarpi CBS 119687 TaxID=1392245 RepID=A0A6A6ALA8_9PLEO|nr:uncharacterized protein P153DRAFT_373752 [Dothidotthia symphoricarpi CBS 119687]KAF2131898.1 hypothetical protein P153DRAFT_373752 [Dothidotthia symphoricarpi CBS 119687]
MPNRQPELYAAAIVPYTAAAVALVSRIASRRRARTPQLVWEDYLAVVAFVVGSGFTFISLYKMRWGLGIPLENIGLPEDQIVRHYFLDLWADMWMYTFSVGLSKFVLLGFYWRTFGLSIIRQPIRILFVCSACWIVVRVTLISMQCQPIRKFWDQDVPGKCPMTPMMSLFGTAVPHLIIECAILLCPIIEIWRLHLPLSRKVAVAAMFASGLLVCGSALASVVHTVALEKKKDKDLTWDGLDDQIWAVCDVNLAHFSTSLPLLRPVFRPVFRSWGSIFSGFRSSSGHSEPSLNGKSVPTVGSAPKKRRRNHKDVYAESTVEFADEGGLMGSDGMQKAIAFHDFAPRNEGVEEGDGIYVGNERRVGGAIV